MSKSFPEWWKHGQKVRTASDGILTLNIAEDAECWLTNDAGKEVSVFSADILGPASTPEACSMTTDITELAQSDINTAMFSSIEGFAFLVVDSLEFEMGRELTDEESQRVYKQVEAAINNATSEGGV
ncbi:TPA: hypothetical protein ACRSAD_001123 [Klebsiella quasipneumoniae]